MNRLGLCCVLTLLSMLLSTAAAGQVTGSGKPNSVPLWTGTSTPSTTLGNSSITENPTSKAVTIGGALQVNGTLTANQLSGPLGTLLYHASFQGATSSKSGNFSAATLQDGVANITAGNDLNAFLNLQSDTADADSGLSPNKPGSFLSLRLKAFDTPVTSDAAAYFVAGGDVSGTALQNGFGFKYVGGVGLFGVSIRNGAESTVNLSTNFGTLTTSPPADLVAILRATSVQFFVNGVLKGTVTSNLPSSSDTVYEIRLINGSSEMQLNSWLVSYLTVGFPSQGAPPAGTF